jgi:hypothetical protein
MTNLILVMAGMVTVILVRLLVDLLPLVHPLVEDHLETIFLRVPGTRPNLAVSIGDTETKRLEVELSHQSGSWRQTSMYISYFLCAHSCPMNYFLCVI